MLSKKRLRVGLLVVLLVSSLGVAHAWATRVERAEAPPADGVTVVTAQGRDHLVDTGRMVAFGTSGDIIAEHRKYNTYFDVDPVPGEQMVVEYAAVEYTNQCPDWISGTPCAHQYVLRTDLRTNQTTVVWETYWPKLHKLHDFDRINDTHIVVADIYRDEVQFVNVSSDEITWRWNANQSFEYGEEGDTGPEGFTHMNDVEMVRDGWVMASPRNLDRVIFLDPGNGLVANWTIGCEDCHDILYEQHNPDYMPGNESVPPTVIVADSENDRIVEFQRTDGSWTESWTYTNPGMHWPRDADRLPNGHTLVTDSNANRVYEIDESGSIVWETTMGNPYEAERLGTGDESAARPRKNVDQVVTDGVVDRALLAFRDVVPSKVLSAALFVLPYWAGVGELLLLVAGLLALLTLVTLELKWRYGGRVRSLGARLRGHLQQ